MKRALSIGLAALVLLLILGAAGVWSTLRASLPDLEGEVAVAGLAAAVTVERDDAGIPTITAATRADAARALGFVHAQERLFQMDLLRRAASGELSALLGPATWSTDSTLRMHRLRPRAQAVVQALPASERSVLDAYVEGVNEGREALGARPFEYLALRQPPAPWQPEDTILAAYAMYLDLQFGGGFALDLRREAVREAMPAALAAFMMPEGDAWDAPIDGDALTPPPVPSAADLAGYELGERSDLGEEAPTPGSNNFAVSGELSATGSAIVADDMHLGLRLPHIWFRASLVVDGRRVTGVTLPGTPLIVVGSNGDVAWGFTNAYADFTDMVRIVDDPDRAGHILTAAGSVPVDTIREDILVGDEVRQLLVLDTPFGPITARGPDGTAYAMQWIAHRPDATNLGLLAVETATTLDDALSAANRSGIPGQNFVAGDRAGRIGWTIAGRLPDRQGRDGGRVLASTDDGALWAGLVAPDAVPRVVDPADGRLWTANSRVVSGEAYALVGDDNYAHGARARQIRDGLRALDAPISERDLLAIQLDDRALFYARWRDLLLATLDGQEAHSELRALVDNWSGRAAIDDAGYRLVRAWRGHVVDRVIGPILAPVARRAGRSVDLPSRDETPVWALVTERPAHLLPSGYETWDDLLLAAAADVERQYDDLAAATWGDRNTLRIEHPMASAIPGIGDKLRMPAVPVPGDSRMPRVAGPAFGASQRMVVSPGHEAQGIFHMPGGQAGHFLSPYWAAGHDDWVEGRPSPFLPGETQWTLTLVPRR